MRISFIAFLTALSVVLLSGCHREKPVARIGDEKISADEFRDRFEKYIHATGDKDNILVRQKILNNMISERAIFFDAHAKGFDADSAYTARVEDYMLQAILDGYARKIGIDTVEVTEEELWDEFRAMNTKAKVRYVYAKTEADARQLKTRLEHGETYAALARSVFTDPRLAESGGSLGFLGYDEMEPGLERAASTLPIGTLSDPVHLRVGWAIIRVDDKVETPLASEIDYAKKKDKLDQTIRERKLKALVKNASDAVAADLHPAFNDAAVDSVMRYWPSAAGEGENALAVERPISISPDLSSMRMVSFRDRQWTVGEFFRKSDRMFEKHKQKVHTAKEVRDVATGLAVREVLLDRARSDGIEKNVAVQAQIQKQKELFILKRWEKSITDTITASRIPETDIQSYFETNRNLFAYPPQVNVAEILVARRPKADSLLVQVKGGADFAALARKNSLRPWGAEHGGELGYAPREKYGPFADAVFSAKVGSVVGPVAIEPFWAVFKILGRQDGRPRTMEESRQDITNVLLPAARRKAFEDALTVLRNRSSISIDLETLGNIVIAKN